MRIPKRFKTERSAVRWSIKLWSWLAKNPSKDKEDYFKFYGINIKDYPYEQYWDANCPLCQYQTNSREDDSCISCPLNYISLCSNGHPASAYVKWRYALANADIQRKEAEEIRAEEIRADAATNILDALKEYYNLKF